MSADLSVLRESLPLVTAPHPERVRIRLGEVVAGGPVPVVIAGPCAVESLAQLLQTARQVKAAGAHGLRGGAFKPRSSPYSFQGLGRPALEMLAAAKVETGLFLTIEVMREAEVDLVADYADLLQIGARNMQNFALLRAVGRCPRPVLLKRGMAATVREWLQAAEYILAEGNPSVILCERGIRTFEPWTRNTFDVAAISLVRNLSGLPVFADPSHAAGRRELVPPLARAALAAGADGLLLEVHPDPSRALSDGDQSLTLEEFANLMRGLAPFCAGREPVSRRSRPAGISPAAGEFPELAARGYRHAPVFTQFTSDELTPVGIFRRLVHQGPGFLLESVESGGNGVGRYSFCGDRPLLTLTARGRRLEQKGPGRLEEASEGDVLDRLRELLEVFRVAPVEGLPRFYGGAVGYLGYDYVQALEPIPATAPDPLGLPDSFWLVPERLVVLDHVTGAVTVIILAPTDREGYERASSLLEATLAELRQPCPAREAKPEPAGALLSSVSQAEFCTAVTKAKEYIAGGDAFQVVLSRRLTTPYAGDAVELYRALRSENPSPYLFLLDCGGFHLVGSSPEMLVRLEGTTAEIRPLAGTRPRGRDSEADRALEAELRADAKECAEHVMLVDLGRNDLGRVCRFGSVQVPELMGVERFSRVMHLVSRVTGELAPGQDAFSLLKAVFPAGTLTGAPKVRAMQLIAELEPFQRGIYGGAVGYVGFNGSLDACIAIRTAVLCDGRVSVQAGAGIVADSDPEREYAETAHKAAAVLAAVRRAQEGRS
ncbi:MAG: anthranilate synthase component I [Bacillota bacterium]|nr:anthranilate synthase component I [Bacillota bacterium]